MRVKAVPAEAASFVADNKWLLLGGAAVAVTAYLYMHHPASAAQPVTSSGDPMSGGYPTVSANTADLSGLVSGGGPGISGGSNQSTTPVSDNGGTVVTAPTITDLSGITSGGSSVGGTSGTSIDALLNLQVLQAENDYSYAMQQLKDTTDIAFANANLAALSLASSNYAVSALLANTFINSNQQASIFSINTGVPGGDITFAGVNFQNSNKNGWDNNLVNYLNNGTIANAINMITATAPPPVQATVAPQVASTPQGFVPTPIQQPNGSTVAAPTSTATLNIPQIALPTMPSVPAAPVSSNSGGGGNARDTGRVQDF